MSKNFVDNDNATALMGAVEESIANTRIFRGTFDEFNALTPDEKAKYSYVATPEIPGKAITDAVTDGDMRPVTSNAVYGEIQDIKNDLGSSNWKTLTGVQQSANVFTGLVVKYRKTAGIRQFLIYASNANSTGFCNLTSPEISSIVNEIYSEFGAPNNVAIGYSAGYNQAYFQGSAIVMSIAATEHYQSALLTF